MNFGPLLVLMASLMLASLGCTRQSPPDLPPLVSSSETNFLRAESCRQVRFFSGQLEKENFERIFECTEWNQRYPALYDAIVSIPDASWNAVMGPIDAFYLSDKRRQSEFFSAIRHADQMGTLNSFSELLGALMDRRLPGLVIKASQEHGWRELLASEPLTVARARDWALAWRWPKDARQEWKRLLDDERMQNTRLVVMDSITETIMRGNDWSDWRDIFPAWLALQTPQGEAWWPSFFGGDTDRDEWTAILKDAVVGYPDMAADFRLFQGMLDHPIVCGDKRFHVDGELADLMRRLAKGDAESFFEKMVDLKMKWMQLRPFCGASVDGLIDPLSRILRHAGYATSSPAWMGAFQHLQSLSPTSTFLVDLISHPVMEKLLDWARTAWPFFEHVHPMMKAFPDSFWGHSGVLLDRAMAPNNQETLVSMARWWRSLNKDEKLFLMSLIDQHIVHPDEHIRDFYAELSISLPEAVTFFSSAYRDVNGKAVRDVARAFDRDDVMADWRRFVSRDQLLEVVRVIAYFSQTPPISGTNVIRVVQEERRPPIRVVTPVPFSPRADDWRRCLVELGTLAPVESFMAQVGQMPPQCRRVANDHFLIHMLFSVQSNAHPPLFLTSNQGLLSADNLDAYLGLMLSMESHGGIRSYLEMMKSLWSDPRMVRSMEHLFRLWKAMPLDSQSTMMRPAHILTEVAHMWAIPTVPSSSVPILSLKTIVIPSLLESWTSPHAGRLDLSDGLALVLSGEFRLPGDRPFKLTLEDVVTMLQTMDRSSFERLERALTLISTTDDRYAAFFVDEASQATHFERTLKQLKSKLWLLARVSPREERERLKEALRDYDVFFDFISNGYGDLIQGLFLLLSDSSPVPAHRMKPEHHHVHILVEWARAHEFVAISEWAKSLPHLRDGAQALQPLLDGISRDEWRSLLSSLSHLNWNAIVAFSNALSEREVEQAWDDVVQLTRRLTAWKPEYPFSSDVLPLVLQAIEGMKQLDVAEQWNVLMSVSDLFRLSSPEASDWALRTAALCLDERSGLSRMFEWFTRNKIEWIDYVLQKEDGVHSNWDAVVQMMFVDDYAMSTRFFYELVQNASFSKR